MIKLKKVIFIFIISGFLPLFYSKSFILCAQNRPVQSDTSSSRTMTKPIFNDSTALVKKDSITQDTAKVSGNIKTTIFYTAKDSAVFLMDKEILLLYKDAVITYGSMKITGAQVEGNMKNNEVTARYEVDSSGKKVGIPVFTDETQNYQAEQMRFNFKTRKGIVHKLVTQQGDGYVHGENVFKDSLDNLYNYKAKYTTCDLPDPHFHIGANKIKMIPNKKVVSGPFNLFVNDIWTPLGFLFGMFPVPKEKASGIIVPTYGEAKDRGFYLSNGGYYLALSDYYDLALTGDIYSLGGWGMNAQSTYRKKYRYNGSLNFRYVRRKIIVEGDQTIGKDFSFTWSHSPVPKGLGRFSANVSIATSKFNARNSMDPTARAKSTSNSAINYSTGIRGTQAMLSLSAGVNQDFASRRTDVSFPQFSFSSGSIIPFQSKSGSTKGVLRQIRTSYQMSGENRISNVVPSTIPGEKDSVYAFEGRNFDLFYKNSRNSITHAIPISTNFKVFKNITITPGISYNEEWRFRYFKHNVIQGSQGDSIKQDTVTGFARAYKYGGSVSANTTFYGILYFKKGGMVEALRHQVNPSLSLSYSPDISNNGSFNKVRLNGKDALISKFEGTNNFNGNLYTGGITSRQSANLSFSVNNTLEAKVRSKNDSVSNTKKIKILDNLSFATGYNLLADSFNLSNPSFTARTRLLNKFDINFGGNLDPYVYQKTSTSRTDPGIRRNKYAWSEGQGFGKISSLSLGFTTNLNPDFLTGKKKTPASEQKGKTPEEEEELRRMRANPDAYVDWSVPWNLNISYVMSYRKNGLARSTFSNNLSFSGDVSLTQKWKVSFNSAYDFDRKAFSDITTFTIIRDLHCWELNVNWSPFGARAFYNIELHVKSSILKDLKLTRKRNTLQY